MKVDPKENEGRVDVVNNFSKGKIEFKSGFSEGDFEKMVDSSIRSMIESEKWEIKSNKQLAYVRLLKYIRAADIQILLVFAEPLYRERQSIDYFGGISFKMLKVLNFHSCEIRSFEAIAFMDAPNIETIVLTGNSILHSCKPFDKMVFPKIKHFDVVYNHSMVNSLKRWYRPKSGEILEIKLYIVDYKFNKSNERIKLEDLSCLTHFNSNPQTVRLPYRPYIFRNVTSRIVQEKVLHRILHLLDQQF